MRNTRSTEDTCAHMSQCWYLEKTCFLCIYSPLRAHMQIENVTGTSMGFFVPSVAEKMKSWCQGSLAWMVLKAGLFQDLNLFKRKKLKKKCTNTDADTQTHTKTD